MTRCRRDGGGAVEYVLRRSRRWRGAVERGFQRPIPERLLSGLPGEINCGMQSATVPTCRLAGNDVCLIGATLVSVDFNGRLIETARLRLSPEMQHQFNQLDDDAQADIAVTLMYCADRLPPVFHAEHLGVLISTVNEIVRSMAQQPDVVH